MPKPRKQSNMVPLKTLRIYCEGEKTEPIYIKGYISSFSNQDRKCVISVEKTRKNTPVQLVDVAIEAKKLKESPDDEFWVVYDRESPAKYADHLHSKAMDKARRHGIKVALSNICFEYWILIHLIDTEAPYSSCDDLLRRSPLNQEIIKLCGNKYEKSRSLFNILRDRIPEARNRGQRLNSNGLENAAFGKEEPFHINPYVGMVDLLDAIDNFK